MVLSPDAVDFADSVKLQVWIVVASIICILSSFVSMTARLNWIMLHKFQW